MTYVLVVDDDPVALRIAARLARTIDAAEVDTATSADEAVARFGRVPKIDVLVTDIEMPGLDGIELATWCRSRWPGVRVITMSSSRVRVEAARQLGLASVHKPMGPAALQQALLQHA